MVGADHTAAPDGLQRIVAILRSGERTGRIFEAGAGALENGLGAMELGERRLLTRPELAGRRFQYRTAFAQ